MEHDPAEDTTSVDMAALLADQADGAAIVAGRYELGDVLGEGGMAVVHRASDTLLHRSVAVKLLRENVAGTTERARFNDEARTLAALSHPGLVTVLDAGVTAERPYLVMELVEGGTLADVPTPLSLSQAASLGAQVAAALAYAHDRGVIHRDVKPANVLLCPDGRIKLADFGIARLVGDTVHHTGTGALIGTVTYLSPEQVEGAELTTAVDVYSLGLVLLELITGTRPFPGPSVESALSRLTRSPDMPLDLPASWWALLSAMTARNPADRPSALEVCQRLQALRSTAAAAAEPVLVSPQAEIPRPVTRSHARGVLVAVAALVLLIGAAAAAGGRGGPQPGDVAAAAGPEVTGQHSVRSGPAPSQEHGEAAVLETPADGTAVARAHQPHRHGTHPDNRARTHGHQHGGAKHGSKHGGKHGHKHGGKHGHKHGGKHGHQHH